MGVLLLALGVVRSAGFGVADPDFKGPIFPNAPKDGILTFDQMPAVSYWNTQGHRHEYPDLFHFANGNKVTSVADWENRRIEISRILQYYEYGKYPAIAKDAGVTITSTTYGGSGASITAKAPNGNTHTWTMSTSPPMGASANGKAPLFFAVGGFGGTDSSYGCGTATFNPGDWGSETNGAGVVQTLFGISSMAGDAPSANVCYAWGMGVIITAIEQGAFGGYYDPAKVCITGYSRYGKAAECIGAFALSQGGNRVALTAIGSAGSGGPAVERYISPAGYLNGASDPLPVGSAGANSFNDLKGKPWYLASRTDAEDPRPYDLKGVRGFAPYRESYTRQEISWQAIKVAQSNTWSGIQSLSEGRAESPGWFSPRFRDFSDLHSGLDIDHAADQPGRTKYGILCTMPFDQYFLSALIAPNGIIFQDGFRVPRNNIESEFANWVIVDEIYHLYAEDPLTKDKLGDPDLWLWRNGIKFYDGTHGGNGVGNEGPDKGGFMRAMFAGKKPFAKFREPPFPIDDPISKWDFYRMNFGRPGHPTIAARVKAMIDGAPVKAMDWHGLLDAPVKA